MLLPFSTLAFALTSPVCRRPFQAQAGMSPRSRWLTLLGFGLSIDDAWPYISEYNERCEPPWSLRELDHKLAEADANKKT